MEVMDYPPDWTETIIYGHYHHHWYTHVISHIITIIGTISDESCIRIHYVMQVASHTHDHSHYNYVEEGKGVRFLLVLLSTICTPLLALTGWSLGIDDKHLLESAKRLKLLKLRELVKVCTPSWRSLHIWQGKSTFAFLWDVQE